MKNYRNLYLALGLFMIITIEAGIIESIGEERPSYTIEWDMPFFGLIIVAFYVFGYMHRHKLKK